MGRGEARAAVGAVCAQRAVVEIRPRAAVVAQAVAHHRLALPREGARVVARAERWRAGWGRLER